jgi:tRNA(Ile)-lysidine synthase
VADAVELAFRRAVARLLPPEARVLVAVSGGGDSVALLDLFARLGDRRPLRVGVAHLDHGLRRGSRTDRRFVERLAADLGLPFVSDRREVGELRRRDESLEEAARRVRREFLLEAAARRGDSHVATGHNRDDQAETVLMRLVRGAGPAALAGMEERGPGPFVRPLLELARADLRAYLRRRGRTFREDPANRDLRFDRNRVRLRLMPLLERWLNPQAARHLVGAADRLREDALHLDAEARSALDTLARARRSGELVLDAAALARLPPPVARRVALLALRRAGVDGRRVAARHVGAVLELAHGRELHLPGRLRARRVRDRLTLGPAP